MASSSNGNGNLMDEFEEAFQACLHALTKQESNTGVTKEEIELEVQQTASKFIDVARQMEAFFLQKRFLISALKPEMLLKDENQELRYEISRKDILINKHYNRLEEWKALLSDQQQQAGYSSKPILQSQSDLRSVNNPGNINVMSSNVAGQIGSGMIPPGGGMSNALQAQLQQQQLVAQQQQQQQQQIIQAQQMQQQMQQMQVGAQQMYVQQQVGPSINRGGGGFNQGSGNNILQGPLAYLEKTTSNIDLVGMGNGRR